VETVETVVLVQPPLQTREWVVVAELVGLVVDGFSFNTQL
jgi:hypothetical protein